MATCGWLPLTPYPASRARSAGMLVTGTHSRQRGPFTGSRGGGGCLQTQSLRHALTSIQQESHTVGTALRVYDFSCLDTADNELLAQCPWSEDHAGGTEHSDVAYRTGTQPRLPAHHTTRGQSLPAAAMPSVCPDSSAQEPCCSRSGLGRPTEDGAGMQGPAAERCDGVRCSDGGVSAQMRSQAGVAANRLTGRPTSCACCRRTSCSRRSWSRWSAASCSA